MNGSGTQSALESTWHNVLAPTQPLNIVLKQGWFFVWVPTNAARITACAEIIVHDVHVHVCWSNGDEHKSVSLKDEDEQDGQFSVAAYIFTDWSDIHRGKRRYCW